MTVLPRRSATTLALVGWLALVASAAAARDRQLHDRAPTLPRAIARMTARRAQKGFMTLPATRRSPTARRAALLALALAATLAPAAAHADAVPDTTLPTCPSGAIPRRDHSVTYCAPGPTCETDGECATGHCEATSFCMGEVPCGGDSEPGCHNASVESTCEPGSTCPGGACETTRRCVPGPVARAFSTCAAARRRDATCARSAGWTAAAVLGILTARARLRRSGREPEKKWTR